MGAVFVCPSGTATTQPNGSVEGPACASGEGQWIEFSDLAASSHFLNQPFDAASLADLLVASVAVLAAAWGIRKVLRLMR